ncbi:MAG TPA: hypothetical protein VN706_01590 [Gemmatimonadaceae bacterium]|nr:hypothetical protein [Gemmatimonadaceae bacterium]
MPQATCPRCHSYIDVENVASHDLSDCQYCRGEIFLYKCTSCMKVTALMPGQIPRACPRCSTLIRPDARRAGLTAHVPPAAALTVDLHNDMPSATASTQSVLLNRLVFRGDGTGFLSLRPPGFTAKADARFAGPVIIRDKWKEKGVTTHMQTKVVLAWSKSIYKALEYAMGCIKGGLAQDSDARASAAAAVSAPASGPKPGWLYVAWVEYGIDVLAAVREWERIERWPAIRPGTQEEILSPTLPLERIVGCWAIQKGASFGDIRITQHVPIPDRGLPIPVLAAYRRLAEEFHVGRELNVYTYLAADS